MQPDPWWEAVNRLEALLLGLLAEVPPPWNGQRRSPAGSLPFLRQMPGDYVTSDSELLDLAVPLGDDSPGAPAAR